MDKTVLIIDDFRISNEVVGSELRAMGFHVLEALSGDDALEYLDGRAIDLVISDYMMPRTNGLDLAIQIRQTNSYKGIPFIILSSADKPTDNTRLNEARISAWLKKPLSMKRLLTIIERVIN